MPKLSKPLADLAVRNAKPYPDGRARKLAGGGGLYLYVPASGSKLWRWDYRIGGKQKTVSLGSYPDLSLAKARELRDAQKARLTDGTDPAAATVPPLVVSTPPRKAALIVVLRPGRVVSVCLLWQSL